MGFKPLEILSALILLVAVVCAVAQFVAAKRRNHRFAATTALVVTVCALVLTALNAYAALEGALVIMHLALGVVTWAIGALYLRSARRHHLQALI